MIGISLIIFASSTNFIDRLKNNLQIKKTDTRQPIGPWIFVILLNIIGFAGYFYLKLNNLDLST